MIYKAMKVVDCDAKYVETIREQKCIDALTAHFSFIISYSCVFESAFIILNDSDLHQSIIKSCKSVRWHFIVEPAVFMPSTLIVRIHSFHQVIVIFQESAGATTVVSNSFQCSFFCFIRLNCWRGESLIDLVW